MRGRPASTTEERARWLWAHRDRWGTLPDPFGSLRYARPLFKEMQAAGLYSRKTSTIDGVTSIVNTCRLAREMHRRGEIG